MANKGKYTASKLLFRVRIVRNLQQRKIALTQKRIRKLKEIQEYLESIDKKEIVSKAKIERSFKTNIEL